MDWKHLFAYITGTVDQELLLRNEYLVTENRMLRHQITGRVRLTDAERKTLAEIGHKLGKQALAEVATIVKPDTILGWHRKLVAQKFDGSQQRQPTGRPKIAEGISKIKLSQTAWYTPDNHWLEVPVWSSPIPLRHCSWKQLDPSQVAPAGSLWHGRSKS